MNKDIRFTYGKTEYVLTYTRKTVEMMERAGFTLDDIKNRPMLNLPALFAGAFKANHPKVSSEVIKEIFDCLTDKGELVNKLIQAYEEPINALLTDCEDDAKNIKWTATW